MTDVQPRYALTELADLAGVTPRTVRFYLSQGLLPSPGATGPGVRYGEEHLDRLRLIRRLQREHLPLAEIRSRLSGLDGSEVAQAVQLADESATEPVDPADTALDYVRRLLEPGRPPAVASLKRMTMAAEAPAPAYASGPSPSAPPPTRSIERSQWERIALTPDIELHVRRPLSRPQSRKVDRLVSIARELLEEDPS
jgi:DNA-binding transcriptional MerR regulator